MLLVWLVGILGRSGHRNRRSAAAIDHDHGTHDGDSGSVDLDEAARTIDGNEFVHVNGDFGGVQRQTVGRFQTILPLYLLGAASFDVDRTIPIDEQARVAFNMQIVVLLDMGFAIIANLSKPIMADVLTGIRLDALRLVEFGVNSEELAAFFVLENNGVESRRRTLGSAASDDAAPRSMSG